MTTPQNPGRRKAQTKLDRLATYLDIAADFGVALLRVRDRPNLLDWAALGTCAFNTGLKVREQVRTRSYRDPWTFFDHYRDAETAAWRMFDDSLKQLAIEHACDPSYLDAGADEEDSVAVTARLGEEEIGWVDADDGVSGGPFYRTARMDETFAALGDCIWRTHGVDHLRCSAEGIEPSADYEEGAFGSELVTRLRTRLGAFAAQGITRSLLLEGPPGTGKSTALRMVIRDLGFRSLHIDLRALAVGGDSISGAHDLGPRLRGWLTVLRPDAVIIDDIDRVLDDSTLFDLLEWLMRSCRLVAATANVTDRMADALLRPGRFDEVIHVGQAEPALVRHLVGDDDEAFARVHTWPIAYVAEYAKRVKSLGRAVAWSELDALEARLPKAHREKAEKAEKKAKAEKAAKANTHPIRRNLA